MPASPITSQAGLRRLARLVDYAAQARIRRLSRGESSGLQPQALTRYLDDGSVPIDNNWVENQLRPWTIRRGNWMFVGSLHAGQRAAAIMRLIRSARSLTGMIRTST